MKLVERLHAFCDVHDDAAQCVVEQICRQLQPVDSESTRQLLQSLNLVTASGKMPSFSDAGARTGYVRKRMEHRSRCLAAALLHDDCERLLDSMLLPLTCSPSRILPRADSPLALLSGLLSRKNLRMASIGGAAGSDVLAVAAMRRFDRPPPAPSLQRMRYAACEVQHAKSIPR